MVSRSRRPPPEARFCSTGYNLPMPSIAWIVARIEAKPWPYRLAREAGPGLLWLSIPALALAAIAWAVLAVDRRTTKRRGPITLFLTDSIFRLSVVVIGLLWLAVALFWPTLLEWALHGFGL